MLIKVMGFPSALGAPGRASAAGPALLRAGGLAAGAFHPGAQVLDLGDIAIPAHHPDQPLLAQVYRAAARQIESILQHVSPLDRLVTLGGDHSTSLGAITGRHHVGDDFDVVWIDAHPDLNRPDTSPSGYPHGMVLAALAGLLPDWPGVVPPDRIWVLGARDIDDGEARIIARHGVHVFGVDATLAETAAILADLGPRVYISFDLDAVDPRWAPGVGTPVPGGFRPQDALELVQRLVAERQVVGMDVVELKPEADHDGQTAQLAVAVLQAALAGVVTAFQPPGCQASQRSYRRSNSRRSW